MILYFTATGNSLYVAKQLDEELLSIPQELNKTNRHYKADSIGIVCPLFEFDMPEMVKEFIKTSTFETNYFYIIITYGAHHGGVVLRLQEFLKSINLKADYLNTIIMHDNAIIVFDMDQQRSIEATKEVDLHIQMLKKDIEEKKKMVQEVPKDEIDFSNAYLTQKEKTSPMYTFPLYKILETCIGCGTCSKVCPKGCINIIDNKPNYDYTNCINCMACIQACPVKAIKFLSVNEPNPNARYRHPKIQLSEIISANQQK